MIEFQCEGMNVQMNVSVRLRVDSFLDSSHVRGLFTKEAVLRSIKKSSQLLLQRKWDTVYFVVGKGVCSLETWILGNHEFHVALGSRYTSFLLSPNKRKTLINLANISVKTSVMQKWRRNSVQTLDAVWIWWRLYPWRKLGIC